VIVIFLGLLAQFDGPLNYTSTVHNSVDLLQKEKCFDRVPSAAQRMVLGTSETVCVIFISPAPGLPSERRH
jgi:hypothetical protein